MFITNASIADLIVVFAKTSPQLGAKGISTFVAGGDRAGAARVIPTVAAARGAAAAVAGRECFAASGDAAH